MIPSNSIEPLASSRQGVSLTHEETKLLKEIFDSNFQGKLNMNQFGVLKRIAEKIDKVCR